MEEHSTYNPFVSMLKSIFASDAVYTIVIAMIVYSFSQLLLVKSNIKGNDVGWLFVFGFFMIFLCFVSDVFESIFGNHSMVFNTTLGISTTAILLFIFSFFYCCRVTTLIKKSNLNKS